MFDPDGAGGGKSARSLLSLAGRTKPAQSEKQPPKQPAAPSLVSYASERPDAQSVHRAARSRREAQLNPLLQALATKPQRATRSDPVDRPLANRPPAQEPAAAAAPPAPPATRNDDSMPFDASSDHWAGDGDDQQWRPLFDPAKIIGGVIKSRYLIASTTILGGALGVAIALSTPKTYTSATDLQIDPRDIKLFDRTLTEGGLPSDATLAIVENQVRVIRSGTVIDKVVNKLKLEDDPEFNGSEKSGGLSSVIGEIRSIFSRSEASAGTRRAALARENLYEGLRVERAGKTFIVTIAMTTRSPDKSALIARTVAETFMESYAGLQNDTAGKASEELGARLTELRKEVETAERKVEAYQAEHELIDAKGALISDDEIIRLNDQLTIAKARTLELNARASTARDLDLNSVVGGGLPEGITSPVISDLRAQYSAARQAVDRMAISLGPRHPQRQAAEAELAGVHDQISAELRRHLSSIQVDLKRAVQLEQDLAARLAQLKAKQGNVGDNLVDLRELEREAAAKRAVYENFLLRARETGEQSGINTANVSIISAAQPPLDANGPSRSMIAIAGTILGFLAGLGLGILRGAWDSLRSPQPENTAPQQPSRARRRSQIDGNGHPAGATEPAWAAPLHQAVAEAVAQPQPAPKTETASPPPTPEPEMYPGYPQYAQPFAQPAAPVANQNWGLYPVVQQPMMASQPAMMQQPAYAPQPLYAQPAMQVWPQPVPQAYAPQPYYQPQPYMPPQPALYAQPAPHPYAAPYTPQQQAHAPQPQQYAPQPAPQAQPARHDDLPPSALDEIRGSLREFREAVRNLTETRVRAVR